MRRVLVSLAILALSLPAFAGSTLSSPATPSSGVLTGTCADNAYWNDTSAGGSCELGPALGERLITVNDYADAASDILRIKRCVAGGSCSTVDVTAQTTVLRPAVTIADYTACSGDTITITTVDQKNATHTWPLVEGSTSTTWESHHGGGSTNANAAGHLCDLINATHGMGVTTTLSTATCPLVKTETYKSVSVASSDTNCATVTNMTDAAFWAGGGNAVTAVRLKEALDRLLTAGTLSGFTTACSSTTCSDAKVGLVPSSTTTALDVSIVNSAAHAFGTVTTGRDGSVIVRNPSAMLQTIRFCGNGQDSAAHPAYLGPILPADWVVAEDAQNPDMTFSSTWCDARDSETETTADTVWHAKFSIKPVAMVCVLACGAETGDTVTFSMRDDAAAEDADMSCSIAYAGSSAQCTAFDPSPSTVSGGSTVAIKVESSGDDDCSSGDVECIVWFTY